MSGEDRAAAIAGWVAGLEYDHIPRHIVEEAKHQVLGILAAMHAGHFSHSGRTLEKVFRDWGEGKDATMIPSGQRVSLHHAVFANGSLARALDYDDFLLGAHPGQSVVPVALAAAEKHGATGQALLVAQVAANEIVARAGLSAARSPFAGPYACFAHSFGAAAAMAAICGLDAERAAAAFSLAAGNITVAPPAAVWGSEARATVAAGSAVSGVIAAEVAASGLNGCAETLDRDRGYEGLVLSSAGDGLWESLGQVWLTDTLHHCVYPGAVYADACIDVVLQLARQHHVDPKKVTAVRVTVGPFSAGAERAASRWIRGVETSPALLTASLRFCVAAAVRDRELSARQFTAETAADPALWELARRVEISEDENLRRRMEANDLVRPAAEGNRWVAVLDGAALEAYRGAFGASVRIELADGRVFEGSRAFPPGGSGQAFDERQAAVLDKFRRETRYILRKQRMERAIDIALHLDEANAVEVREMIRSVCSER